MLISNEYKAQNRELHASNEFYGVSGKMWAGYVDKLIESEFFESVLDYGAGKQTLKGALPHRPVRGYDPCVAEIEEDPAPAELVVCTDVLEHIEPKHLNAVLRHLASKTIRKLFFNISIQESTKTLPDGRNSHLIVKPAEWWRDKLTEHFRIVFWQEQEQFGLVYGEARPRDNRPIMARPTTRRPPHPDMEQVIATIREQNHKYSDAWGRLNSFNLWEGVDDEPADMQVVLGILEHCEDMDLEMRTLVRHAHKAALLMVPITKDLPEKYWRRLFEKFLRIGDWHVDQIKDDKGVFHTRLACVGSPMVGVMGITAIGAISGEDRWAQLVAATQRVSARIQPAEPHGRRAVLACYGPSLRHTVEVLRQEAAETGAAIVSVSGAHDFLLENGIVPNFHIECDPRPHKADNIAAPHPGVQYLIGSSVHSVLLDKLLGTGDHDATGMDVRLWHISTPEHATRIIDELGDSSDVLISGGGSVGLRAIPLLYTMGYRDFSIYGMDCSFESDGETVQQWAGKHAGKRQDVCEVQCGERLFISSPILLTYATGFFEAIQRAGDISIRLYGDGLLQDMIKLHQQNPDLKSVVIGDESGHDLQREHKEADGEHPSQ